MIHRPLFSLHTTQGTPAAEEGQGTEEREKDTGDTRLEISGSVRAC